MGAAGVKRAATAKLTGDREQYLRFRMRFVAPKTVENNRWNLTYWAKYMDAQGRPDAAAKPDDAALFIAGLEGRQPASLYHLIGDLRGYYAWLIRNGRAKVNPFDDLPRVRDGKQTIPRVFSPEEYLKMDAVLSESPAHDTPDTFDILRLRNRAMLALLFLGGLRNSEVREMNTEDLDLDARVAIISGKGSKERRLPLHPHVVACLDAWLRLGRPCWYKRAMGPVFMSERRQPITRARLQQLVKEVASKAGIRRRVYPHLFRHSAATGLLRNGMPPEQLRMFLGHENLQTTGRYLHLLGEDVEAAYQQAASALIPLGGEPNGTQHA